MCACVYTCFLNCIWMFLLLLLAEAGHDNEWWRGFGGKCVTVYGLGPRLHWYILFVVLLLAEGGLGDVAHSQAATRLAWFHCRSHGGVCWRCCFGCGCLRWSYVGSGGRGVQGVVQFAGRAFKGLASRAKETRNKVLYFTRTKKWLFFVDTHLCNKHFITSTHIPLK